MSLLLYPERKRMSLLLNPKEKIATGTISRKKYQITTRNFLPYPEKLIDTLARKKQVTISIVIF
jgi:hypothetical protein